MIFRNKRKNNTDRNGDSLINSAINAIKQDKSNPNRDALIQKAMDEMYDYFATLSESDLCNPMIKMKILDVEYLLKDEFIPIKSEPIFNPNFNGGVPTEINNIEDAEQLLDYVVHKTRAILAKTHSIGIAPLAKSCISTSLNVEEICSEIGIDTIHIGLNQALESGNDHHFTIVRISFSDGTSRIFLIDCSYRQFFTKNKSNPRRIGVVRGVGKGCSVGYYMTLDEKRKSIAEQILQKGYIQATPDVIKSYFDAIIFSGRDKSFYDSKHLDYLNPNDLTPEYTVEDYVRKLNIIVRGRLKIPDTGPEIP